MTPIEKRAKRKKLITGLKKADFITLVMLIGVLKYKTA